MFLAYCQVSSKSYFARVPASIFAPSRASSHYVRHIHIQACNFAASDQIRKTVKNYSDKVETKAARKVRPAKKRSIEQKKEDSLPASR